jgi:hypothetical protein
VRHVPLFPSFAFGAGRVHRKKTQVSFPTPSSQRRTRRGPRPRTWGTRLPDLFVRTWSKRRSLHFASVGMTHDWGFLSAFAKARGQAIGESGAQDPLLCHVDVVGHAVEGDCLQIAVVDRECSSPIVVAGLSHGSGIQQVA